MGGSVAVLLVGAVLATGCEPVEATGGTGASPVPRVTTAPTTPTAPVAPSSPSPSRSSDDKPAAPAPTRTSPAAPAPSPSARVLMKVGSEGARVRELQARLRQTKHFARNPTGYYGTLTAQAVEAFQRGLGIEATGRTDTVTWQRLLAATRTPTASELDPPTELPVAAPDPRCLKGRVLCVSKESRTLAWMIDGRVVSVMDVRFGSEYTPTREGVFSVYWKSRHHVSTLYGSAMPYAMFFSGGQAVHYSADFAARGYGGASHGCVNVRDEKKISALYEQVKNGDKVVIYH
ncbi:L,D-transpeptidase family protein [Streptomyces sp. NBC_00102]|uniref:L,D-transpeptidase family protein n=1 Tax=Streptomyces sp. NBC_00102 TaxID=2975652 RepID=UPI0022560582|nr:L,D-transpeptidase family protein [Streptomyces sp. NBC_00102]MCX5399293.1 L,D-transpeptidase family protein [Streptomyces sp. NBC_00102]